MSDAHVENTDISSSPAFHALNDLFNDGTLTQAQVDFYKSKYAKLHEEILKIYQNEKTLLPKAKELNEELRKKRLEAEEIMGKDREAHEELERTRTEFAKAEAEVVLCEERDAMLTLEIAELQKQKEEIAQEKETREREAMEALRPRIEGLEQHISQLTSEIEESSKLAQKLKEEKAELAERASGLQESITQLSADVENERAVMMKVRGEPSKIKKQADLTESSLNTVTAELKPVNSVMEELDKTIKEQAAKRKTLEDDRDELSLLKSRHNDSIEQKMRIKQEQERDLAEQLSRRDHIQEEALQQDITMRALQMEQKRVGDSVYRMQREKEETVKLFRKAELTLAASKGLVPNLKFQLQDYQRLLANQHKEKRDQLKRLEELNRDIDIFINDFLQEEGLEKEKAAALAALLRENKELEAEFSMLMQQQQSLDRETFELGAKRDSKAREYAKAVTSRKETEEEIKVKDIIILDLSKRSQNLAQQIKELKDLYELVKNEKNKTVNLIQTSQQALAEMKEKVGILQNEIEILQSETSSKDKALTVERQALAKALGERDAVRSEVNKLLFLYKDKQQTVDQKISEIDKLNSIINVVEKDMVRLKKQYEQAVEERNYTGIQLIDRNDELCILYEKSNIQEQILRNGELELNQREEELRVLALELGKCEWMYSVTTKLLPQLPRYRKEIEALRQLLEQERKRSEELSYELESPSNESRYRLLQGKDLSIDEMQKKITHLEDRLNLKKEQLLEKELVLEEVGALSERLRNQAVEGREETLDIAKSINEYQSRIKRTTRKLMACVSELSMYQATAMKLEQEKGVKVEELHQAKMKLEQGLPPTEEAEREWERMLRKKEMRQEMIARRQEEVRQMQGELQTTAIPRPNAYMPEDLALPRPYGAMAPFKPSEPGASMRHIVKPQPREIEI
uniref:Cilia- and flagella-associated protein 58 central coiled coil domain-containing protein n=1 Tax=Guillardia theta TaxID=55529 RepID=A0A7S4KN77_GUITH|mmetsp:Transcript_27750/g.90310  ORF Transcript_27750/g.90310 Transcript_27750/m.90310 type:complete len:920 (+) Transcript_27750:322-3081(+)